MGNALNPNTTFQTTLPGHLHVYLKQIAVAHYGTLQNECEDMVAKFIRMAPWAANPPLPWRDAPSRGTPGCKVVNLSISKELGEQMLNLIEDIDKSSEARVSQKTFLYTAVYWWVVHVYNRRS